MQITPYPEIDGVLEALLDQAQEILDANLSGLYLYGSLVTGDFDVEISDIDLLAVTMVDVDAQEFEQLDQMHHRLVTAYPAWKGRIEVQYVAARALQTFKTQRYQMAAISPGEPFNIKEAGMDWLINWYVVRESGHVLFGPAPQTIIPAISKEEFLQAVLNHARYWLEWTKQPQDQRGQSYAILTMCRAWYASCQGEQVSKKKAITWVQQQFPQWASLVQNAFAWRKWSDAELCEGERKFPETVRFIQFAYEQCEACQQVKRI